jgi:hypothetical protein
MDKSSDSLKLATRTYFYNLLQASSKNLFVIDFTGMTMLAEVNLKVVKPSKSYFEGLNLPDDPFDAEKAKQFLEATDVNDSDLLETLLPAGPQRDWFALRRRCYTVMFSNSTSMFDKVLAELDKINDNGPINAVYVNYFTFRRQQIVDHYPALVKVVKDTIGKDIGNDALIQEMKYFLAGIRLCEALTVENKETFLLKRGYIEMLSKYPFMDKTNDPKIFLELKRPQALPNEIIDSYIYLGNGRHVEMINTGS